MITYLQLAATDNLLLLLLGQATRCSNTSANILDSLTYVLSRYANKHDRFGLPGPGFYGSEFIHSGLVRGH